MQLLPKKLLWDIAQDRWASILNPLIKNPSNNRSLLKNVKLVTGSNVINHGLGQPLQGWNPVRIRASATFYDTQDSNPTPDLTLVLVSSANVTIDLEVF
jgi:hypothetical protein